MPRKKKSRKIYPHNKFTRGNIIVPLLVIIVIIFAVLLTSSETLYNKTATDPNEKYELDNNLSESESQNLQLKSLKLKKSIQ